MRKPRFSEVKYLTQGKMALATALLSVLTEAQESKWKCVVRLRTGTLSFWTHNTGQIYIQCLGVLLVEGETEKSHDKCGAYREKGRIAANNFIYEQDKNQHKGMNGWWEM